jgi:hypothetical protein
VEIWLTTHDITGEAAAKILAADLYAAKDFIFSYGYFFKLL